MKKTLLLASVILAAITINAQKVWNLGGDATLAATSPAFPLSAGIGNGDGTAGNPAFPVIINGLNITGSATNTNMGAVNASAKTFSSYSFPNRFQLNGAGYSGAAATDETPLVNMPTQRYLSFNVSGNSSIYVIGITGSSSSARKLFVTDGTNLIGSVGFPAASVLSDGTVNYTGPATTLYVFANQAINLCLLSATNYVVTKDSKIFADKGITVAGHEISNPKNLKLEVYNALGKKILSSTNNLNIEKFEKGIYVVRAEGVKGALKFVR